MRIPKADIPWVIWAMHYRIHSSRLLAHSFTPAGSFFSLVCHFFSLSSTSFRCLASSICNCSLEDISVGGWKLEEEEDPQDPECDPLIGHEALCHFVDQPPSISNYKVTSRSGVSASIDLSGCCCERLMRYSSFFCDIEAYREKNPIKIIEFKHF